VVVVVEWGSPILSKTEFWRFDHICLREGLDLFLLIATPPPFQRFLFVTHLSATLPSVLTQRQSVNCGGPPPINLWSDFRRRNSNLSQSFLAKKAFSSMNAPIPPAPNTALTVSLTQQQCAHCGGMHLLDCSVAPWPKKEGDVGQLFEDQGWQSLGFW
jgi:hypothetical protein